MTERLPANFKDFTRKSRARCCAAHYRYYANPWNFLETSKTLKDNNGAGSSSGGGVGTCGTNGEIVDVQRTRRLRRRDATSIEIALYRYSFTTYETPERKVGAKWLGIAGASGRMELYMFLG